MQNFDIRTARLIRCN